MTDNLPAKIVIPNSKLHLAIQREAKLVTHVRGLNLLATYGLVAQKESPKYKNLDHFASNRVHDILYVWRLVYNTTKSAPDVFDEFMRGRYFSPGEAALRLIKNLDGSIVKPNESDGLPLHRIQDLMKSHPIVYVNRKGDLVFQKPNKSEEAKLKRQKATGLRGVVLHKWRIDLREKPIPLDEETTPTPPEPTGRKPDVIAVDFRTKRRKN